jgi:hypothetical protein
MLRFMLQARDFNFKKSFHDSEDKTEKPSTILLQRLGVMCQML